MKYADGRTGADIQTGQVWHSLMRDKKNAMTRKWRPEW